MFYIKDRIFMLQREGSAASRARRSQTPIALSASRTGASLATLTGAASRSGEGEEGKKWTPVHWPCGLLPWCSRRRCPPSAAAGSIARLLFSASTPSPPDDEVSVTGAAYSFKGATTSLTNKTLTTSKKITLVRHGLSSWNAESRVQGSSNLSVLTEAGVKQAEKCRDALANMKFDVCFSSPISRAKATAKIIWQGKEEPLVFLDSLKEAHLFFLEGMTNADAKKQYPELYTKWREDPADFHVNGIYPVRELWGTARQAWEEILLTPGENFLVVTHKSILRALICTALGLPPERFRAIDVNNGGMCVFTVNTRGEAMLEALNMTAHMYSDHTYQY